MRIFYWNKCLYIFKFTKVKYFKVNSEEIYQINQLNLLRHTTRTFNPSNDVSNRARFVLCAELATLRIINIRKVAIYKLQITWLALKATSYSRLTKQYRWMPERAANENPSPSSLPLFISGAPMLQVIDKKQLVFQVWSNGYFLIWTPLMLKGIYLAKHFGTAIDSSSRSAFIPFSKEKYSVLSKSRQSCGVFAVEGCT